MHLLSTTNDGASNGPVFIIKRYHFFLRNLLIFISMMAFSASVMCEENASAQLPAEVIAAPVVVSAAKLFDECEMITGAFEKRLCVEKTISKQSYVLIPYRQNYLIGSFVDGLSGGVEEYQSYETKFQISFKIPLSSYHKPARCFWIDNTECITFFGYTQVSVWQMFNLDRSAPFRDTNFEPELMVAQLFNKNMIGSWNLRMINYGLIDHQSNGKVPPTSRSWNRSYIDFMFENGNDYLTFKFWERWKEDKKVNPTDFKGDDNENIEKYVGHGELKYLHVGERINYSFEIRDSEFNSNKINFQFNWSIPLKDLSSSFDANELRLYVQYFNGYGETLIDYDVRRERIGVGLMLTDWL